MGVHGCTLINMSYNVKHLHSIGIMKKSSFVFLIFDFGFGFGFGFGFAVGF
jgi:hypothetical protein